MENSVTFPYKTKTRITIWCSNPTPGYLSEGNGIKISKRPLQPHIHCSTVHNSQDTETIYPWRIHMQTGIIFSHKKKSCHCEVDEPRACYTEWSKSEREKQTLFINAYIWDLEKWYWWTYLQSRNRDADVENGKLVGTAEEGESVSITYKWPQHDVCVRGTTPWLFRILDANAITLWCGSWIDLVLYSGCDSLHFILLLINAWVS